MTWLGNERYEMTNAAQLAEDLKENDFFDSGLNEDAADFIESLLSHARQREAQIEALKMAGCEMLNWYRKTYQNEPSEHVEYPFVILNNMTANVRINTSP